MTTTASFVMTAAHAAARLADSLVAYRTRFSTALKSAWAAAKQTITSTNKAMTNDIADIQVTVAENQDYKIYLQGSYNAAGLGDSRVHVVAKNGPADNSLLWISKFGYKEAAQFVVSGWAHPAIDKAGVESFLAQYAAAIEAAQIQFKHDYRSESDKAYSRGMDNLMNDNTEAIEDGIAR